jgi:preprotein translocase subunit SecD
MNRYPVWKFAIMLIALLVGALYTLPNLFGEAPAVQVASAKASSPIDASTQTRVALALQHAGVQADSLSFDGTSVQARFKDNDVQIKARDAIQKELVPDADNASYVVALNLVSRSPRWLSALRAVPMYLGLDLRGGVHLMMQVDMQAVLTKKAKSLAGDIKSSFRDKEVRYSGIIVNGQNIEIRFRDAATLDTGKKLLADQFPDLQSQSAAEGAEFKLTASIKPEAARKVQEQALKQNITTLRNRVNELGVSEPVIQQQGLDRIVVQLPGIQDAGRVHGIIGRTATLEMRLVDESAEGRAAQNNSAPVPFGDERYLERNGQAVIVKKEVVLTGESLTDAQPGFDSQSQQPKVDLTVDAKGGRIMRDVSRENLKKRMAIVLFEKGKGEVLTAPVIQGELGNRFQISGSMSVTEANDLALLLRAGSLAAPMEIIEEFTIGPTLGAENIAKGFHSVTWGFVVIVAFMCIYYMMFGVFSSLSLGVNLLLLVAVLSMLQATLTLPGIAAMALALGMAIDSNVLINERVREELRAGAAPQSAIHAGYERAWGTIVDSNITTLIVGLALLAFGSGPVRGFAVVHVIGILTSMFSAVFFSRGLVNLWYGREKKLKAVAIGTVWKAEGAAVKPDDTDNKPEAPASKGKSKSKGKPAVKAG